MLDKIHLFLSGILQLVIKIEIIIIHLFRIPIPDNNTIKKPTKLEHERG